MALLFALGFLAMLLVLGLGFVTTSLLSQKIAANNATRVQARLLARSAAARAALSIMLYNDQAIVSGNTVNNYDAICSYGRVAFNDDGTRHPADGAALDNDKDAVLSDQLKPGTAENAAASILKYSAGSSEFTGEKSNAKWIYFYDSPKGTEGRKIIGRAAFQVLPDSTQWLSLYGVTGGAKLENDLGAIPYNFRWGRGVEELKLDNSQTLNNWSTYAIRDKIPHQYDTLYNTYSDFFTGNADKKKSWIECWFTEGRNTVAKDAFPVLDPSDKSGKSVVYYNRFNIGDRYYESAERNDTSKDNWYDRFKAPSGGSGWTAVTEEKKNSPEALTALTDEAVPYQDNDSDDTALDSAGLPFLKRIGNEQYSFDSLELLRRQIAANFNDYCDSDSIPTSDVKASSWSITDPANFPKYTGNEKTLYINEVAGLLPLDFNVRCVKSGSPLQLTFRKNQFKLLLELINMYDNSTSGDVALLDPSNVRAEVKIDSLSFNLAMYGRYTFTVTYLDSNGLRHTTSAMTVAINSGYGESSCTLRLKNEESSSTIDNFAALADGYSVGSYDTRLIVENQSEVENTFLSRIKSAAEGAVPAGGTFESYTFTDVQIGYKIRDLKLKLSPIVLRAKNAVAGVIGAGDGIDFVRFDKVGEVTFEDPDPEVATRIIREGWSHTFQPPLLLGGFEALDPRQNLNPSTTATSDWRIVPTLVNVSKTATITDPSLKIDGTTVNTIKVSGGAVNRNSSPASPKDHTGNAFGSTVVDKETATDPAWRGNATGQHVSTAYIRNSPMVSPWEVGLIHRGRAWQTLNIKRAGGFGENAEIRLSDIKAKFDDWTAAGTKYENGDGAIFEYTKMSISCRAMGKIPLTLLRTEAITKPANYDTNGQGNWNGVDLEYNKDIIKMLFDGIRRGQSMKDFYAETKFGSAPVATGGSAVTVGSAAVDNFIAEVDSLYQSSSSGGEFRMRSQFLNSDYGANEGDTAFTFGLVTTPNTDAVREELVGKTVNLLAVTEETPPNIFRVIVVAQTIRDVGGIDNDVSITKLHNGSKKDLDCRLGRFDFVSDSTDWEKNTYYDEITGEVKALVTIERVPSLDDTGAKNPKYGRMVITKIEYID